MLAQAISRSISNLLSPSARWLVFKSVGLAALFLLGAWLALHQLYLVYVWPSLEGMLAGLPDWLDWVALGLSFLSGVGLAFGLILLMAPVTTLVAGFFLDDIAEAIETRDYPADPPGTPLPLGPSIAASLRFVVIVLAANILALLLYFIPGVNIIAFFLVNGYLIGREYFEFVAMRHMDVAAAREFRRANTGAVMAAGCVAALLLAIPFVNLLTPIFAAGMMVHLFKALRPSKR